MLEWVSSERKNINGEWASLFIKHTLTHWGAWVRERTSCGDHLFCFWVLLLPLVLILSLRKLRVFLLYGFPEENYLCLLSLVIIDVHVILSDNIPRSYSLNDKNLTALPKRLSSIPISFQYLQIKRGWNFFRWTRKILA